MPTASIVVRGAWATLSGGPTETLDDCASAIDPQAKYNLAFREGRWDGRKQLYAKNEFPAGLVPAVTAYLEERNYVVTVIDKAPMETLNLDRFTPDFLGSITLRWYQHAACLAMLNSRNGVVRSPTGSGKTYMALALARFLWDELNWRTLIVVPKKGLTDQTAREAIKVYGRDLKVGLLGDGKRVMGDVIVATASTLLSAWPREQKLKRGKSTITKRMPADMDVRNVLRTFEVLILDETHHASADGWYKIAMFSGAKRRFGLSGTPLKDVELSDLRMTGATGRIVYEVPPSVLMDEGVVARPHICMVMSENASGPALPVGHGIRMQRGTIVKFTKPLPYADAYQKGIVENDHHNSAVVRAMAWLVDHGKQTLVLCRKKEHFLDLKARIEATGVEFLAVWGDTDMRERNRAKKLLDSRGIKVVLASTIWDEGEDVPGIEAVVFAEGVKVSTNALQRVGRGMRKKRSGDNVAWIVDFVPTNHTRLMEHALLRCQAYEGEGYEVTLLDTWPAPGDETFNEHALLPFVSTLQAEGSA